MGGECAHCDKDDIHEFAYVDKAGVLMVVSSICVQTTFYQVADWPSRRETKSGCRGKRDCASALSFDTLVLTPSPMQPSQIPCVKVISFPAFIALRVWFLGCSLPLALLMLYVPHFYLLEVPQEPNACRSHFIYPQISSTVFVSAVRTDQTK